MRELRDYAGRSIRLTDERLAHILTHPEMAGMEQAIADTLAAPQIVVQSRTDPNVRLYYRRYAETRVGDKYLCAAVKVRNGDAFIVTAYLTDRPKKGGILWSASKKG